ncbi:SufS family cysteine desulfurase [Endozoicomonas sp. G2_1]|uniref:SufS family cysteine desulfurase n=1 Tax=Endozoicomonas sp. G2_1 TaxID=2821091 RepID=UPI0032AEC423
MLHSSAATSDEVNNNGKIVYFDNAATTQKPKAVIDAVSNFYQFSNANVHRGAHQLSQRATQNFEAAREQVRSFVNAKRLEEIIWTKGATEAINLVAYSWAATRLQAGDEIVVSYAEHHANIVPWQIVAEQTGATIKVLPLNAQGQIDIKVLDDVITASCKLVAVNHISNVIGKYNPLTELITRAKSVGALTLVDGAQAAAHQRIDLQALDCDFYVFSGHKVYGPTGIGVLYGKYEHLAQMRPYQAGGEMIKKVSFSGTTFNDLPHKFESGTPNISGAIGFAQALSFLSQIDQQQLLAYEQYLTEYTYNALAQVPGLSFVVQVQPDIPLFSFVITGHHHQDIAAGLDSFNIAIRSGHHCAMPLMEYLQLDGCLRVSLAPYNTTEEVDYLVVCLAKLIGQTLEGEPVLATNSSMQTEQALTPAKSVSEIENLFANSKGWDGKHRTIMLLSKLLERLPKEHRRAESLITGCESDAWLDYQLSDNYCISFIGDSDAKVVRGLMVVVLAAYQGKTASEIVEFDIEQYFTELGLINHLSPSRGNGVKAIVERIKSIAYQQLDNYSA